MTPLPGPTWPRGGERIKNFIIDHVHAINVELPCILVEGLCVRDTVVRGKHHDFNMTGVTSSHNDALVSDCFVEGLIYEHVHLICATS